MKQMRFYLLFILAVIQISAKGSFKETAARISKNQFIPDSSGTKPQSDSILTLGYYQVNPQMHSSALFTLPGDKTGNGMSVSLPQMLTGRIPGLFVIPANFQTGNESYLFLVRGVNSLNKSNPLFVVDGIPDRDITNIDANDIESISLLKDGTSAMFGSRSADGVLFINTKRGKLGKPSLTIKLDQGFNQPARLPEMADAATYATMLNEVAEYASGIKNSRYSVGEIQKFRDGSDPLRYPNTDWFNSVYKKMSWQNSLYASLNGGMKYFNYFVSAGTKYQDGIFKNSASNSTLNHVRANLEGKISLISLSINLGFQQQICNAPTVPTWDIFRSIFRADPTMPDFWPGHKPAPAAEYGYNPVVISTDATGTNKQINNSFQNSARLSIDVPFISGLKLNAIYAYDLNRNSHTIEAQPWTLYGWDGFNLDSQNNPVLTSYKFGTSSQHTSNKNQADKKNFIADFNYSINLSPLSANVTGGFEKQDINYSNSQNYWPYNGLAIDSTRMTSSKSGSNSGWINYFASLNLIFLKHYIVEFTGSLPKSSFLPDKSNSQLFGSASIAWVISEESFWKEKFGSGNVVKIHGSIGKTGTDNPALLSSGMNFGIGNPNITWEVSNQSDIGFNAAVLDSKLTIEADFFYNFRSQIPIQGNASLPSNGGFMQPFENIGKVSNKGIEFILNYQGNAGGKLKYNISLSGSYARNKIIYYDETPGIPGYQQLTGRPIGSSVYYQAIGVFKDSSAVAGYPHWPGARPGDIIFRDVDGNDTIDNRDRIVNDKSIFPRFQGGVNIDLHYGQFDLSVFIQGSAGGVVYINPESGTIGNYFEEYAANRWTSSNPSTTYPRAWNRDNEYWMSNQNTFWLRSTDYIRLKNVEIGYSLKSRILQKFKIQQFRVYLRGFNLLTLDKLKLIDPENPLTAYNYYLNSNLYAYPACRYFDVGLSCTF